MHLDDTKHKVYIYNLDDELSSSDTDGEDSSSGKLVFLPDIEKHLRTNRIPAHVLRAGPDPAELVAGKELVLYRVPSSISVPEEQDSVRKAIIEARARARERQRVERLQQREEGVGVVPMEAEGVGSGGGAVVGEDDSDAMELD